MPLTKIILVSLKEEKGTLAERLNKGFNEAKLQTKLNHAAVADFSAIALYLLISDKPEAGLIEWVL